MCITCACASVHARTRVRTHAHTRTHTLYTDMCPCHTHLYCLFQGPSAGIPTGRLPQSLRPSPQQLPSASLQSAGDHASPSRLPQPAAPRHHHPWSEAGDSPRHQRRQQQVSGVCLLTDAVDSWSSLCPRPLCLLFHCVSVCTYFKVTSSLNWKNTDWT